VHWLGYRDDVPSVLRALDIAVVPSHWEGFGFIAAESMAASLPVVAADASSLPEIVRDGIDGILVPAHDAEALAGALVRLSRDPGMRARMGAAGKARAIEQFGVERMVDEYERILESVSGVR
jgi:glycosyltransferase involved in cell wall biosynthesis